MMASWLRRIGIRLHPLFHPRDDEERRRIKELRDGLRRQEKILAAQQDELKKLTARLQGLEDTTDRTAARMDSSLDRAHRDLESWRDDMTRRQRAGQAAVNGALKAIRSNFSRKGTFTATVLHEARRIPEQSFREQAVLDRLARCAASGRPILAGPWTGEVGFELIYWAPFVRWFAGHFGIDPARLTIVSRGGPQSWYRDIGGTYVDLFSYVGVDRFVSETANTLKQKRLSVFDADLIRQVARDRGLKRAAILHPRLMYTLFRSFFARDGGIRHVIAHTAHRRIDSPGRALVPGLPDDYVAVKFYFRPSFPRTPENVSFIRELLDEIGARHRIVLLGSGSRIDEHEDYSDPRHLDLASCGVALTPQNNLEVQTAVVAGARAFVGTYGGFCYLAPMCGVPATAFYGDHLFYLSHRYMADVVFARLNVPALAMLPTSASPLQRRAVLDLFAPPMRQL
jgi:hypothetical protein